MHLSGPYVPRASTRVLKYLELWHIWLFTIASLIRLFPFMFLAMLAMKLDGITKNLSQTIKNFPINNANISKLLSLLMHLAIWANRNLRFSFQLLYKLEKLAWTSHLSASHLQRKEPQLFSSLLLLCFVKLILVKFYISLGKLREVKNKTTPVFHSCSLLLVYCVSFTVANLPSSLVCFGYIFCCPLPTYRYSILSLFSSRLTVTWAIWATNICHCCHRDPKCCSSMEGYS